MDRRKFMATSAAMAAGTSILGKAFADDHKSGKKLNSTLKETQRSMVLKSARQCLADGYQCLDHCSRELASGNTMMAQCNVAVQNMIATCEGLEKITVLNTISEKSLKAFVAGCIAVCEECESICKEHADHSKDCKACAESCRDCIDTCKKIS